MTRHYMVLNMNIIWGKSRAVRYHFNLDIRSKKYYNSSFEKFEGDLRTKTAEAMKTLFSSVGLQLEWIYRLGRFGAWSETMNNEPRIPHWVGNTRYLACSEFTRADWQLYQSIEEKGNFVNQNWGFGKYINPLTRPVKGDPKVPPTSFILRWSENCSPQEHAN